jgi:TonB family protein
MWRDSVYGLDANAIKAMKQWQFEPGAKDGKPVAVRVAVEMTFTLK